MKDTSQASKCECNCHDPKNSSVPFRCIFKRCQTCAKPGMQKPISKPCKHGDLTGLCICHQDNQSLTDKQKTKIVTQAIQQSNQDRKELVQKTNNWESLNAWKADFDWNEAVYPE